MHLHACKHTQRHIHAYTLMDICEKTHAGMVKAHGHAHTVTPHKKEHSAMQMFVSSLVTGGGFLWLRRRLAASPLTSETHTAAPASSLLPAINTSFHSY